MSWEKSSALLKVPEITESRQAPPTHVNKIYSPDPLEIVPDSVSDVGTARCFGV